MKGYDPGRSPTSEQGRDQVKAFVASTVSEGGSRWFEGWGGLDWAEYMRWVTENVVIPSLQRGLFNVAAKYRDKCLPREIPGLETQAREAWRKSLTFASTRGIVTLATMRPQRDAEAESWAMVNLQALIYPYGEGVIGRISGPMGSGKTNTGAVIIQEWLDRWGSHEVVTNIPFAARKIAEPDGYESRIHYADSLSRLLALAVDLAERRHRWMLLFDELGNAGWLSNTAGSNSSKDMATLIGRNWRKYRGNAIFIDQRAAGFPSIVQEFSRFGGIYECYLPRGIMKATITLPNGRPWAKRATHFPKSILPFDTYGQSAFSIDLRIPDLLEAIAAAGIDRKAQLQATREFLRQRDVPMPSEVLEEAKEEDVPEYLNPGVRMARLAEDETE